MTNEHPITGPLEGEISVVYSVDDKWFRATSRFDGSSAKAVETIIEPIDPPEEEQ